MRQFAGARTPKDRVEAEQIVLIYIPATIMLIMYTMGLSLLIDDFKRIAVYPKAAAIGVFGQLIVLPALGFLIAWALKLTPEVAAGLILLAACSGGATSNLFTRMAGGDVALSVTLTAVSGTVSIISIPLVANLGLSVFADETTDLSLPVGKTIFQIVVIAGVPLLLGMLTRWKRPALALKIEPVTIRVAMAMLTIMIIGAVAISWDRVLEIASVAALPSILLNLSGMSIGYAMARLGRLPRKQVIAIPLEVGMQNAAFALAISLSVMENETVAGPAVIYGVLMYFTCLGYVGLARRYSSGDDDAVAAS